MGYRDSSTAGGPTGKVARLIEAEGLDALGPELERRWTASGDERASLRELADTFNRRLLESRLEAADVTTLAGEVANHYRLLTDEDVGAAERTRARRRLEREGVDVEALTRDFVSYQAVRTYLTDHRGVEYDADSDPIETLEETVGRLRGRLASVTESRLEAARRAGGIDLGGYDVTVSVEVSCRNCGRQVALGTLLAENGCDCD